MKLLPAVISSMDVFSSEPSWNTESSQKVATLLRAITQFDLEFYNEYIPNASYLEQATQVNYCKAIFNTRFTTDAGKS